MSVQHHDERYYAWLRQQQRDCLTPGCLSSAEHLHHISLIASDKHSGALPRRHSSYQVVPLCASCHDRIHSEAGERAWANMFPRGMVSVMALVSYWLADYAELHGLEVRAEQPRTDSLGRWRQYLRKFHDLLTEKAMR